MKKNIFIFTFLFIFIFNGCADKTAKAHTKFIKTYTISTTTDKAVEHIKNFLKNKNYIVTSVFNHEEQAIKLKEMLYPAKTINLYNSKISTKLIQCNASMALEMPIRLAVYSELGGKTFVSYTDPEYWSLKHNIKDSKCLSLIMLIKNDLSDAVEGIKK